MFSQRIRECRISRGLTQKQVAEMINCHTNAYQNYELGKREPNFATLIRIADFFEVTLDYLLGRTD